MNHQRYFQFPYGYSVPNGMMNNRFNNNSQNYNMNPNYVNGYPNMNNYQNLYNSYNYNYGNNNNLNNFQNYQNNQNHRNNQNYRNYPNNINSSNYLNSINNSNNINQYNQYNQNNLSNRGENGLENGIPNSQRQRNFQPNNNNINYNINPSQNQNINPLQINNIKNINGNQNQNIQNGNGQNGANINNANNVNIENGQAEEKKEEKVKTYAELNIDYENDIRKQIEQTSPLISEDFDIKILINEYSSNEEYLNSIKNITKKYKYIRKVRRDGNCFYRSFIFRLFEHICIKNNKILFEKIKQKIIDAKELTERNGYEWAAVEDFYNLFLKEFTDCFNSLTYESTVRDYLDTLFCEREKGNYLIYFIRFCISAYIKEQKDMYQMYIESPIDEWITKEVEAIDHEADQVQIMACVNYFDIGVKIEYLNKNQSEVVKLPYDKPDDQFFIFLLFTPGHYDILYP